MNAIKFERIKEEIETADRIYAQLNKKIGSAMTWNEYHKNPYMGIDSYLDIILPKNISDREKKSILNEYGERLSYVCEHYLKALIIPNIHYEDIENESDIELNKIFSDRRYGIKRYSHYFVKFLNDNESQINEKLRESILIQLGKMLHHQELASIQEDYHQSLIDVFVNDSPSDHEALNNQKERLKEITSIIIERNNDAYPQSRYGMFSDYIADLDFLYNLCRVLISKIQFNIPNSLYIKEMQRHVFIDSNSRIIKEFDNGEIETFNVNEKGEILLRHDDDYYSIHSPKNQNKLIKVHYQENNSSKVIKYDNLLGSYYIFNSNELRVFDNEEPSHKK